MNFFAFFYLKNDYTLSIQVTTCTSVVVYLLVLYTKIEICTVCHNKRTVA